MNEYIFESKASLYFNKNFSLEMKRAERFAKRLIDISGAVVGVILSAPLMLVIAGGIKLTSRGSVFFKQKRIGYLGKPFYIFKFRSMNKNSTEKSHQAFIDCLFDNSQNNSTENNNVEKYKHQIDRGTTLIGKFIRKTSLDELPQLFNVLRGEMSLVGPRPHPVYEVKKYKMWHYRRMSIKPGITGLSKVNVRCTPENYDEAMRFDLKYIDNWSLLLDLKILFKTIPLVLCGKGAY